MASSTGQRRKLSSQWSATASPRDTSIRMLVARAIAPEPKHLGVVGLLVLRPEGRGLAQGLSPGDPPLVAEGIQLLAGSVRSMSVRTGDLPSRVGRFPEAVSAKLKLDSK